MALTFVTSARLSPDKKLEELILALRLAAPQLPPFRLRIAGGPERGDNGYADRLRRSTRGLPVEWCGEVTDMAGFLQSADLFVMISEPPGCPNASLEALAAGLPVLATDVGGASEQVLDGVTGRLVPPGDPPAFAEALIELAVTPERRKELGKAARIHAEKCFSVERMARDYAQLFFPQEREESP